MRKLSWFALIIVILGMLVNFFKIAIICLGIFLFLFLIRKIIINRTPGIDTKLKWGGKL